MQILSFCLLTKVFHFHYIFPLLLRNIYHIFPLLIDAYPPYLPPVRIDKIILKANAAKIAEQDKAIRGYAKKLDAAIQASKYEKVRGIE